MAITDEQNERLHVLLDALFPIADTLNGNSCNFVKDQKKRHKAYGADIFMSPKQFAWLENLYAEHIGDDVDQGDAGVDTQMKARDPGRKATRREEPRAEATKGRKDDMDDEIPF